MSYTAPGYPHLSYSQLEEVWIQAGGSKAFAPLMAAIALAESGGWAGATNPTDNGGTQTSWGLWQISTGTHASPAPHGQDVYDPVVNAKLAIGKLHGQGLSAWGTYTSGAYRQYLKGGVPASTGAIPGGSGHGTGGASGTGTAVETGLSIPGVGAAKSILGDIGKAAFSGPLDWSFAGDPMKTIGASLHMITDFFLGMLWLINPANQLRLVSGLLSMILLGTAVYFIATA